MERGKIKTKEELVDAITNYYNEAQTNKQLLEKMYGQWLKSYSLIRHFPKEDKIAILWQHISDLDIAWSDMEEFAKKHSDMTAEYIAQEIGKALQLIDPDNWKIRKKYLMEISASNLGNVLPIALEHLNNALHILLTVGARMDCTYINTKERAATLWSFCDVMRLHRAVKGIERYLTPKKEVEEVF